MASAREQDALRQHIDDSEDIVQLPYEILEIIFRTLPTPVVVHRVGVVCKDWHSITKDDELWRLRCGLPELPPNFSSWFAYAQRQTMREQALDHLYGRAGLTHNWHKGLMLLSVLADAGDDYAMALYGWSLKSGAGLRANRERGTQLVQQSNHVIARAFCSLVGVGMQRDEAEAYRLLTAECDASDPHVQYLLGWCYEISFDHAQATLCYERAGNHIRALENLAEQLLKRKDFRVKAACHRALALLTQAATQGCAAVQYNLGHWYERGMPGVFEKDIAQAKHWYSLSAEQGRQVAAYALCQLNREHSI